MNSSKDRPRKKLKRRLGLLRGKLRASMKNLHLGLDSGAVSRADVSKIAKELLAKERQHSSAGEELLAVEHEAHQMMLQARLMRRAHQSARMREVDGSKTAVHSLNLKPFKTHATRKTLEKHKSLADITKKLQVCSFMLLS